MGLPIRHSVQLSTLCSPLATNYLVTDGVGYKGESQERSNPQVKEVPDHLLAIQHVRPRQWIAQHAASRSIQEF